MWLSEIITEHGIGNGASLLIFTNIVSNLPNLTKNLINDQTTFLNTELKILIIGIFFLAISGIVYLQEGVRMVPLISSKELNVNEKGFANDLSTANYIPLRLNQAGVMPIIFTAALLVLPAYIINMGILPPINIQFLSKFSKILYWVTYFTFNFKF